jgi:hypothetical protein
LPHRGHVHLDDAALRAPRSPAVDRRGVADLDAVLGLALEPRWDRTDDGRAVRAPQRVVLRRRDLLDGRVRQRRVVEGLHARRVVVVDLRHGGQLGLDRQYLRDRVVVVVDWKEREREKASLSA